jgi:hypothetical protein
MAASTTHATCSGVFLRMDPGFGLLAHSPYTGLTYAIDVSDADAVTQWLNKQSPEPLVDRYHSILKFFQVDSTGMFRRTSSARYFKYGVGSSRPS